jgi:uncharacterized protein YcsI (UPF0317 family)
VDGEPDEAVADLRREIRAGRVTGPTSGAAPGYVQANLVVLPESWALEFTSFAVRNPRACPLLDVTAPGEVAPRGVAPSADLRTDVPRYRVHRDGEPVDEVNDVRDVWRDDLVSFLLGCSFTFETALRRAGLPLRHVEQGRNVPMYVTDRDCVPAGRFAGPEVVSMRPIPEERVDEAVAVTARFPDAHGAPLHTGDPTALGIHDLDRPDHGDAVDLEPGDVPVFWACGVTPQEALRRARPDLAITHAPGHMFVTDRRLGAERPRRA